MSSSCRSTTRCRSLALALAFRSKPPEPIEPVRPVYKIDPKLVNAWKSKAGRDLTEPELLAMPEAEYMNDKQLEYFRATLQRLKDDLLSNAGETTEHLREDTSIVPDPADRATIEEEHALELRTRDRERKLIRKIDEALKRIEDGSYGYCLETGEEIAALRADEAADRVRQIVRDLRIFSRGEEEQRGAVDLHRLLDSTLRMAWNEIRHRARLVKRFDPAPRVLGNEARLGQVFLNLVKNALEACRARLRAARGAVPWILEVRYRHGIRGEDGFRMHPGYSNFQPVSRDEHLADDRRLRAFAVWERGDWGPQ